MKKRMLLSLVVMVLTMSLAFSTVAFAGADGTITATVNGLPVNLAGTPAGGLWAELAAAVARAQELLDETHEVPGLYPVNPPTTALPGLQAQVPVGSYGATVAAHDMLRSAISAAVLILHNQFSPGEVFDLTIGMEGNTGFAGLIMQIGLPVQLQLHGFSDNRNYFDYGHEGPPPTNFFEDHFTVNPAYNPMPERRNDEPIVMPAPNVGPYNFYHVGWAGRTDNFSGSGDFFTLQVRVVPGTPVGELPPITIALANAIEPYDDPPTDLEMESLQIALPCGTVGSGHGNIIPLVRVNVVS